MFDQPQLAVPLLLVAIVLVLPLFNKCNVNYILCALNAALIKLPVTIGLLSLFTFVAPAFGVIGIVDERCVYITYFYMYVGTLVAIYYLLPLKLRALYDEYFWPLEESCDCEDDAWE